MQKESLKKKGFTLIEILIATTLFAVVMVITTGVVGQSVNYQSKLKTYRTSAEDSRRISDMIARDIREAKGGKTFNTSTDNFYTKGIAILNASTSSLISVANSSPDLSGIGNVLILETTGNMITYVSGNDKVYRRTSALGTITKDNITTFINGCKTAAFQISDNSQNTTIGFNGYAPSDNSTVKQQGFVSYKIISQTLNYNTLPAAQRSQTTIQSTVTSRNYN